MLEKNTKTLILEHLSDADFAMFGMDQLAYIKPVNIHGRQLYALSTADGRLLSMQDSEMMALVVARHNNLEAVIVH